MTCGVVAKPGMATGSSGLCIVLYKKQMMNNGSAEMTLLAYAGRGIEKLIRVSNH